MECRHRAEGVHQVLYYGTKCRNDLEGEKNMICFSLRLVASSYPPRLFLPHLGYDDSLSKGSIALSVYR